MQLVPATGLTGSEIIAIGVAAALGIGLIVQFERETIFLAAIAGALVILLGQ